MSSTRSLSKEAVREKIAAEQEKIRLSYVSAVSDIYGYAMEIITLARSIRDKNAEGLACLELALYYCSAENKYKTSLEYADKGIELLSGTMRTMYLPYYYLNKGRCYQFMGDQIRAQEAYLEGISLLEKKKLRSQEETRWMGSCYYNAYILFNQGGMEFSRDDFLEKAFQLYSQINDKPGLSNCYNSFASLRYKANDLPGTLENLLKAYDLSSELNAFTHMSIFTANIGLVYAQLGETGKFREFFALSAKHTRKTKSRFHEAHMNGQMGEALFFLDLMDESLERLLTAEEIFSELGAKGSLTEVYRKKSQIFAAQGDFQRAYESHIQYSELIKERFNEEKAAAIMRARMIFEIEEKENEAIILKQKNEEIEQYMNKLQASNNELQQFAYVVSHDLREPLRTISTYIRLLEKKLGGRLDQEEQEFIDFVVNGSRNMNELISDLLTFSKISFVSDTELLDLSQLVRLIADETRLHYLPEKEAAITLGPLPSVQANRTHMKQLFGNLISNAIKYNKNQVPAIRIVCDETQHQYIFTVSDNGIGIAPEFRERVFQIFQRLHTKADYNGTGVGLAICKKIVENMGGHISLTDNADNGSDFIFTLPK
jgi:signal transduction histidine kinase